jgi:hypothetical protein
MIENMTSSPRSMNSVGCETTPSCHMSAHEALSRRRPACPTYVCASGSSAAVVHRT